MTDIYVAFDADLSGKTRAALRELGWKLYANALRGTGEGRGRHVVRVPERDAGDLHKLITDALGAEPANPLLYYDPQGAGDRLGVHPETVKRRVARGELMADRRGSGPTAGLLLHKHSIDHLAEVEAHQRRMHQSGTVVGYGDFAQKVEASNHPPETKRAVLAVHDKRALFDRVEREMYEGPDAPALRQRFEDLDAESRFEAEAREMAERVRRAERLRRRALELLEADEG